MAIAKDAVLDMAIKNIGLMARFVGEASTEEINIEEEIRKQYSLSQEVALHRKRLMGTATDEEWDAYTAYVEECITKVRERVTELEED